MQSALRVRSFTGRSGNGVNSSERCGWGLPTSSICRHRRRRLPMSRLRRSRLRCRRSRSRSRMLVPARCMPRRCYAMSRCRPLRYSIEKCTHDELASGHARGRAEREEPVASKDRHRSSHANIGRARSLPDRRTAERTPDALLGEPGAKVCRSTTSSRSSRGSRAERGPPLPRRARTTVNRVTASVHCCAARRQEGEHEQDRTENRSVRAPVTKCCLGAGARDDPSLPSHARSDRELDLLDRDCVALVDLEYEGGFRTARGQRRSGEPGGSCS